MNAVEKHLRARNLRLLAGLAGLFLLPLALAFWLYYATDWRPIGTVNHGELIQPPRPLPAYSGLPADLFRHKWSLVYIGDGQCDQTCRSALLVMPLPNIYGSGSLPAPPIVLTMRPHFCAFIIG